jgi:hypothetical protein
VTKRLELVAELHGEESPDSPTELFANVGTRPKLTGEITLLLAAGRTVRTPPHEPPRTYFCVGLQFNLPDQFRSPVSTALLSHRWRVSRSFVARPSNGPKSFSVMQTASLSEAGFLLDTRCNPRVTWPHVS